MRVLPVVLDGGRGQGQKYALPEVSVKGGQGEAKSYTKGGEKAKGGEEMNREEVVQAALKVARYCENHMDEYLNCDCPFAGNGDCFISNAEPAAWELEVKLRTRGLKHGSV